MMDNIQDIALGQKPEYIDMDAIEQAGAVDDDLLDLSTLSALDMPLIINDVEFPPPTTCVLSLLEVINSPFVTGDSEVTCEDVIKVLYVMKYRERAVRASMFIRMENMAKKSPLYYEKYIQNIKQVLTLSPFNEEIYEFGETLGVFSWFEAGEKIAQYIQICMNSFELIPAKQGDKKKGHLTENL